MVAGPLASPCENLTVQLRALNVCGDGCRPFLGRTGKKAQRQVEEPQEVALEWGSWAGGALPLGPAPLLRFCQGGHTTSADP